MMARVSFVAVLAMLIAAPPAAAQRGLPVCADSLPFTGDTTGIGYVGPEFRSIIMPPAGHPKSMNGGVLEVRFLVNTEGVPDSFVVFGFVDPKYEQTLRKTFVQFRFSPARLNGCRLQGWSTHQMTFGRASGRMPAPRQPSRPLDPLPPAPVPSPPPRP